MPEYILNLAGRNYTFRIGPADSLFVKSGEEWQRCARLQLPCGNSFDSSQILSVIRQKYQLPTPTP